ncbi:MAG: cytochrome c biogenesis protein ResB [Planctomycetota bacterium]|nr:cytochrome c biogenesis protein ResB [Planctomycetota bacterium]
MISGDRILRFFGSQGLAALLMLFLLILTFLGTLEQTEHGLYQVQKKYFESWFLIHHLGSVPIPLPGGLLCMIVFSVNLLVGGILRLRVSRRNFGNFVIHVGIAVMMAAGLVKLVASDEGYLRLWENQEASEYISHHQWEIVVFETNQDAVVEYRIGEDGWKNGNGTSLVSAQPGTSDRNPQGLPFGLELTGALTNCRAMPVGPRWQPDSPAVDGWALMKLDLESENERNTPGLLVRMQPTADQDTPAQQALLWGGQNYPWTFEVQDRTFAMVLRKARHSMPFSIRLDNFEKVDHPGIATAKEFRSDVTQNSQGSDRQIRIEMNDPLRDQGLVLFQSSWGPSNAGPGDDLYSVFAVVRNPSDYWPLYSCIVIAVGMAIAFIQKFLKYSKRQTRMTSERAS